MTVAVIFGSLLVVAFWEFCRARRQREFPALRRRLGNVGFWGLNLFLAAFLFPQAAFVRPQIEALSGVTFPTWPISDAGLSVVTGFLLLDFLSAMPCIDANTRCRSSGVFTRSTIPIQMSM